MKAWGRRTWLCMWGEIMCLKTLTGSCIGRARRTWRIGCKVLFLFYLHLLNLNPLTLIHSPFITDTLFLKGRRARMLVACWENGTWSSPGRCSTLCTPCSALHQGTVSPIPSTHHPTATPTISATLSLWVVLWQRQSMIIGYWSATSLAASTSTSWAKVSGMTPTKGYSQAVDMYAQVRVIITKKLFLLDYYTQHYFNQRSSQFFFL